MEYVHLYRVFIVFCCFLFSFSAGIVFTFPGLSQSYQPYDRSAAAVLSADSTFKAVFVIFLIEIRHVLLIDRFPVVIGRRNGRLRRMA